jgi:hypothetical protein
MEMTSRPLGLKTKPAARRCRGFPEERDHLNSVRWSSDIFLNPDTLNPPLSNNPKVISITGPMIVSEVGLSCATSRPKDRLLVASEPRKVANADYRNHQPKGRVR